MSLDLQKIKGFRSEDVGFFRFKRFDKENFLITDEIGEYCFLAPEEFEGFIAGKIEGDKALELKEKGFIRSPGGETGKAEKYAEKNHFLGSGPNLHIVVTTLRCNHKCLYCHASAGIEKAKDLDMSMETAEKILDTILYTSSNNITIEFQGGEPLLNWDVLKFFIENAREKAAYLGKNLNLALVTNLSLMDEEKLDYLVTNYVGISTSLDGDELIHNENRVYKDGNSFEKTTFWIKRIHEEYEKRGIRNSAGEIAKIGALMTVTKKSLTRAKEIIDEYVRLGMDGIFIRMLNPYGFALSDMKNLSYSPEEFGEFYKEAMDHIISLNIERGVCFREQLSSIYLSKIMNPKDPNYMDERSPCGACIGQLAYNYDGKVYTCDEGRMLGRMGIDDFCVGSLEKDGSENYISFMNSDVTKTMVQASTIDGLPGYNDDVYKPYIGICPIYNYKMTGNIYPNYSKDTRRKVENIVLDYLFNCLKEPEKKKIFEKWIGKDVLDSSICK